MSEICGNCKGKVVFSKWDLIILILGIAFVGYFFGVINTRGKMEKQNDELAYSISENCREDYIELRTELTSQLSDCERGFKTVAEDGRLGIWDLYYRKWYLP